jgi:hypothetical protein
MAVASISNPSMPGLVTPCRLGDVGDVDVADVAARAHTR